MSRIILFGGSFNPIHQGHLAIAKAALKQVQASELWFLPSLQSPLKDIPLVSFEHRCQMIQLMISPFRKMRLSRIEAEREGLSYTYDTVKLLIERYPEHHFIWLMGSDQMMQFEKWHKHEELITLIRFAVYPRDHDHVISDPFIPIETKDIYPNASESIRQGFVNYADPKIVRYFMDNALYIDSIVKHSMSESRYLHVKAMTDLALRLGRAHRLDQTEVYLAGMLHDIAKEWSNAKLAQWLNFVHPAYLEEAPALWHQKVGAAYVHRVLQIRNKDVLSAIAHHVEGDNSPLSQVIYIADKCDETRAYDASTIIELAKNDLNRGYQLVRDLQMKYLDKERNI